MWFGNLLTSTELQGFHYYQKKKYKCGSTVFLSLKNYNQNPNHQNCVFYILHTRFIMGYKTSQKFPLHGLSLRKFPIKNHITLFGLGRVVNQIKYNQAPQSPTLISGQLNELPLSKVAKLIKESKKGASTADYIMTSLRMLERFKQVDIKFKVDAAVMVLTDLRQLGFLGNVDFGRMESMNMITLPWNMIGYVCVCSCPPPHRWMLQ